MQWSSGITPADDDRTPNVSSDTVTTGPSGWQFPYIQASKNDMFAGF